jgi:hypothetical protein
LGIICRANKKDRQEKASFSELNRQFELAKNNNRAQSNKNGKNEKENLYESLESFSFRRVAYRRFHDTRGAGFGGQGTLRTS